MNRLEKVLGTVTATERLEIVDLMGLYAHAPASAQYKAMTRLDPILSSAQIDVATLMTAVREASRDLKRSIR